MSAPHTLAFPHCRAVMRQDVETPGICSMVIEVDSPAEFFAASRAVAVDRVPAKSRQQFQEHVLKVEAAHTVPEGLAVVLTWPVEPSPLKTVLLSVVDGTCADHGWSEADRNWMVFCLAIADDVRLVGLS